MSGRRHPNLQRRALPVRHPARVPRPTTSEGLLMTAFRTSETPCLTFPIIGIALMLSACASRSPSSRLSGATQYRPQIEQGLSASWATLRAEYPAQRFLRFDTRRDRLHVVEGTQPGMPRGSVASDGRGGYTMYVPRNPDQGFFDHEGLHLHLFKTGHDAGPRGDYHHRTWSAAFRKHP